MNCLNCGAYIPAGSNKCLACGTPINQTNANLLIYGDEQIPCIVKNTYLRDSIQYKKTNNGIEATPIVHRVFEVEEIDPCL